jgi:hypothetical protein
MFPKLPIFEVRRAHEDAAGFGLRLLQFVIANDFTPGTVSPDTLDLACHASGYAYTRETTPGTAEAVNRAVTMMRASAARERARVKAALLSLGFTDEPITPVVNAPAGAQAAGGPALTAAEVEFVRTMIREFGDGSNGSDDDNGHKVRVRKPKPVNPPAGCAAPF